MAGLDPAIHSTARKKDVDGRAKPGHDEGEGRA
ncbi:MAG: ABC transporter [Bradyrhizobiaceae bacterium]|nr:MAG: ABC transporter [Bradyrhizobiaceae bacterium]